MEKIPFRMFGIYDKDLKIMFGRIKIGFFLRQKIYVQEEVVTVEVVFILG